MVEENIGPFIAQEKGGATLLSPLTNTHESTSFNENFEGTIGSIVLPLQQEIQDLEKRRQSPTINAEITHRKLMLQIISGELGVMDKDREKRHESGLLSPQNNQTDNMPYEEGLKSVSLTEAQQKLFQIQRALQAETNFNVSKETLRDRTARQKAIVDLQRRIEGQVKNEKKAK